MGGLGTSLWDDEGPMSLIVRACTTPRDRYRDALRSDVVRTIPVIIVNDRVGKRWVMRDAECC